MILGSKDLLGIDELKREEIEDILSYSDKMYASVKAKKYLDNLKGKCVATLFYENSTRTRVSFQNAALFLGAHAVALEEAGSSILKGESLVDTVSTLKSLNVDAVAIRHPMSGAVHYAAGNTDIPIINAGDGAHEHPTQALLDALTVKRRFGGFKGLKLVIAGDIKHSRVARSNILLFNKMGADVTVCAPLSLMPDGIGDMGCKILTDLNEALKGANAVMALRMQFERQKSGFVPSLKEYSAYYRIGTEQLSKADKNAILMHPAPINRGIEITGAAADCDRSVICEQITSGLAVRMAVLDILVRRI